MKAATSSLATHLEVATAIAEGRADAGIGTLAPSRSLGLEFVPLVWERYDLLTTDEAFYHQPTQAFFEMVKPDWLRQLVATLPGYEARQTRETPTTSRSWQGVTFAGCRVRYDRRVGQARCDW